MSTPSLLTIFNDQFIQLLDDIQSIFPNNADVLAGKNSLITIRKANPKLLISVWLSLVYIPYKNEIDSGDVQFFMNKDYNQDLDDKNPSKKKILEVIDSIREPLREMGEENQMKTMKYIQNLSKLSVMYNMQQ
jgi:hypothetical protein